jgi:biofilm PGA synthesis N-glycosyltransferase PgaC
LTAVDLLGALGPAEWLQLFALMLLLDVPRYLLAAFVLAFLPPLARLDEATSGELARRTDSCLRVSGIIACHNEERNVANCVASMRANDVEQIIVVLDGPSDATHEALAGSDVIAIELPERVGKALAMNAGFAYCTNEFVLVADADVTFEPGSVAECIRHFGPHVGGVGFDLKVRNENASLVTRFQAVEYAIAFTAGRRIADALGILSNVSGAAGLFRRDALAAVGGWDVEVAEDAALAMKLRVAGWELGYAPLAHAWTSVPATMTDLGLQRLRWDASIITIWWRKFRPLTLNGRNLLTSIDVLLFGALLPLILPVYLFWLWGKIDGHSLLVLLGAVMVVQALLELIIVLLVNVPLRLLFYIPLYVLMQMLVMRPTRVIALVGELAFNITRRDDYVPPSERWRLT